MATLGQGLLLLAFGIALYGIVASLLGASGRGRAWVISGRRATYLVAGLACTAYVLLTIAFLRTDLSLAVVATHTSLTTPVFYKIGGVWSSQEGSLLLWVSMLSLWSAAVLFVTRRKLRDVTPYAQAVLLGLASFFLGLLVLTADPFAPIEGRIPVDGSGLNPLLRHPMMMLHPVALYGGYTLFAVPFAFAVGALAAGRIGSEWIAATRRFTLGAWLLLGIGVILGARWSYAELGWGGYWAWDPVENASLMPWLIGTAFLHSVMIQEKRGMLRTWNVSLILATGVLCILGTFLVRSGILTSIHAFGASTLGIYFLILIGVMAVGSVALVLWRRPLLRSENRIDSLLSREAIFLGGNVLLVALCVVVIWGTFFPLIGEALTGEERPLELAWWTQYTVPIAVGLVGLTALGPLIAWRRTTPAGLWSALRVPVAAAALVIVGVVVAGAADDPWATATFALAAAVLGSVGQEAVRGWRARRAMSDDGPGRAAVSLVTRNRRRYGGYLVHLGIATLFAGVAASSAFDRASEERVQVGDSIRSGPYEVRYAGATANAAFRDQRLEKIVLGSRLRVFRDGRYVREMRPSRSYYPSDDPSLGPVGRFFGGEAASDVALAAGPMNDLWIAMRPDGLAIKQVTDALDERFQAAGAGGAPYGQTIAALRLAQLYRLRPAPVTIRVQESPMVSWIWLGAGIMVLGGLVAIWPAPDLQTRRITARYKARVARDVGGVEA